MRHPETLRSLRKRRAELELVIAREAIADRKLASSQRSERHHLLIEESKQRSLQRAERHRAWQGRQAERNRDSEALVHVGSSYAHKMRATRPCVPPAASAPPGLDEPHRSYARVGPRRMSRYSRYLESSDSESSYMDSMSDASYCSSRTYGRAVERPAKERAARALRAEKRDRVLRARRLSSKVAACSSHQTRSQPSEHASERGKIRIAGTGATGPTLRTKLRHPAKAAMYR